MALLCRGSPCHEGIHHGRGSCSRVPGYRQQLGMADFPACGCRHVPERRTGHDGRPGGFETHRHSRLVTAGVGITVFCGVPRFCVGSVIEARPIVTVPQTTVETHLAWRRSSVSGAMRRFVETSELVGQESMKSSRSSRRLVKDCRLNTSAPSKRASASRKR
jgi:DNA-binding transcriptional LysR family regulator